MRDTAYIVQYRTRTPQTDDNGRDIAPRVDIDDRIEVGPNHIDITGPDAAALLRRISDFLNRSTDENPR